MDQKSKVRHIVMSAMIVFGGVQGVYAQSSGTNDADAASTAIVAQTTPAAAPVAAASQTIALTPDEAKQSATGNVAELQQMIHGNDLTELRTTYNGSYGASLMFYAKDMTYYVALFQQKNFWRVIKTQDEARAEQIYRDFARQTVQLSDVEIRRAKLEAQKAYTDRLVALSQERASRLQADLNIAHEQQTIVNSMQQQTRAEAAALAQQKAQSQEQLRATQRQVRDLQRQLESGLPTR
ncbi:DUF2968 domain-containing protein [Paraburkholderia sp. Tr-20389]|uniref:DUF2968 domain-containing protein n=1 Tax=Paraburkholderia sp. Tr-20389 TaxID=2703903 RepID=UPI001981E583|nr:DUF2968 domain-containing protein [Paraburkholderia sp. Tr-20389]MBN3758982.1 DUF2968 domain-containing protein [Paraburkholderia sp. Tr-20389]